MQGGGHRGPLTGKVWAPAPLALGGIEAPQGSSKPTGKVCYVGNEGASASQTYNAVNSITLEKNLQTSTGVNLIEISI